MEPTRTCKVVVRHSQNCPDKHQGMDWRRCNCRKSLLVYDGQRKNKGGKLIAHYISCKTRSWSKAETAAQEWLDQFDPVKQELKQLRTEKERKQTRIEEAVALYVADMVARLGNNGTVGMARSLLGHVDAQKQVTRSGHLFNWLGKQVPRPTFISDLTSSHLAAWRASWKFDDYTASQRWGMVCAFFNFCERQGWVEDTPTRKLARIRYETGSRTAIFTDEQYQKILEAVSKYDPENVPATTRQGWKQRLTTFIELLRWSGMALIDAVQWRPELVDDTGVLRYRRQKTGELATVALPEHLTTLMHNVPLERDSLGAEAPFRMKGYTPHSDTVTWRKRLMKLFPLAGITSVRNEIGKERSPHPHMLRDTFAVWNLRHGVSLHAVAKMLGHSNPLTTAKAYLPWVKELEDSVISEARRALQKR